MGSLIIQRNARRRVQQGTNLMYPWMAKPYFALPTTGLSLVSGVTSTIYGDTLINLPIENKLHVTYICDIGTQSGNNFVVTPIDANIGDHSLTITFKNGSRLINQYTITVTVLAIAPVSAIKVLMIGDSIMNGGSGYYATKIREAIPNTTFTFLGSLGTTTTKHEGRSGYKITDFATNFRPLVNPSPFFKAGVLDLPAYFTDNSIDVPDYVYIQLGVNDIFVESNDGLTAGEIAVIINSAKILADAFLAYNHNLKIIFGLPTLTGTTRTAWNIDYNGAVMLQDWYIENMHKYYGVLISTYANSIYNERVDCSYAVVNMNRTTGYPKTASHGVHPAQTGYEDLGKGMALDINKQLKYLSKPIGLTVVWVNDYAKIDFTDRTGGVASHEVWQSKNGAAYNLVTTLTPGTVTYNHVTWQNENISYKIIAKDGVWLSDYSAIVSISTPIVLKTDQTSNTNVVFTLNIAAGKTVNADWGDGSNEDLTGNASRTKVYTTQANPYYIVLSGDINSITNLSLTSKNIYGDMSKWVKYPTSATTITLSQAGSVYGLTGDISDILLPSGLQNIYIEANYQSNKVTGAFANKTFPVGLKRFDFKEQNITNIPRGNYKYFDNVLGLYCIDTKLIGATVDDVLVDIAAYFSQNTPINSSVFHFGGTDIGKVSATGLAAKASIEAAYVAAGYVANITVRT